MLLHVEPVSADGDRGVGIGVNKGGDKGGNVGVGADVDEG